MKIKTNCFAYIPQKRDCAVLKELDCYECKFFRTPEQANKNCWESLIKRLKAQYPMTKYDREFLLSQKSV